MKVTHVHAYLLAPAKCVKINNPHNQCKRNVDTQMKCSCVKHVRKVHLKIKYILDAKRRSRIEKFFVDALKKNNHIQVRKKRCEEIIQSQYRYTWGKNERYVYARGRRYT